jgi:solute carrier family 25 protein 39/40
MHTLSYTSTVHQLHWRTRSSVPPQVICFRDGELYRVNGFRDAAWRIWKVEGVAGLWKGVGTTLCVFFISAHDSCLERLLNSAVIPVS